MSHVHCCRYLRRVVELFEGSRKEHIEFQKRVREELSRSILKYSLEDETGRARVRGDEALWNSFDQSVEGKIENQRVKEIGRETQVARQLARDKLRELRFHRVVQVRVRTALPSACVCVLIVLTVKG